MLKFLIILLTAKTCFSLLLNKGTDYIVTADEDSFFQPCDASEKGVNANNEEVADIFLEHRYDEDDMETLITNGNITMKVDIPEDALVFLDLEIFHWKRGKWEKTLYSMKRENFCKSAFDPKEIWYMLTTQVPPEDRICPPKKGTTYHMNDVKYLVELKNILLMDLEGQYKLLAHFKADVYAVCYTAIINIWKN